LQNTLAEISFMQEQFPVLIER